MFYGTWFNGTIIDHLMPKQHAKLNGVQIKLNLMKIYVKFDWYIGSWSTHNLHRVKTNQQILAGWGLDSQIHLVLLGGSIGSMLMCPIKSRSNKNKLSELQNKGHRYQWQL